MYPIDFTSLCVIRCKNVKYSRHVYNYKSTYIDVARPCSVGFAWYPHLLAHSNPFLEVKPTLLYRRHISVQALRTRIHATLCIASIRSREIRIRDKSYRSNTIVTLITVYEPSCATMLIDKSSAVRTKLNDNTEKESYEM